MCPRKEKEYEGRHACILWTLSHVYLSVWEISIAALILNPIMIPTVFSGKDFCWSTGFYFTHEMMKYEDVKCRWYYQQNCMMRSLILMKNTLFRTDNYTYCRAGKCISDLRGEVLKDGFLWVIYTRGFYGILKVLLTEGEICKVEISFLLCHLPLFFSLVKDSDMSTYGSWKASASYLFSTTCMCLSLHVLHLYPYRC
jgi:hypothetical protein